MKRFFIFVFLWAILLTPNYQILAASAPFYYSQKYGAYLVTDAIIVNFAKQAGEIAPTLRDKTPVLGIPSIDELNQRFKVKLIEPLFPGERSSSELSRYFRLVCERPVDVEMMVELYSKDKFIKKAEPIGIHQIDIIPNDPLFGSQWGLNQASDRDIDAPEGWDLNQGDTLVLLGDVDTGVDWDHPDLAANIWINQAEYNGSSGVDDDENGYIDDVRGWDWVDVGGSGVWPGEDSIVPDSNPMDFNGHGTHVGGIMSAVTNNGVGVAGVGWKCKIMALRAGWQANDGRGYVRMDFCAQAIRYATRKGVTAINCSWGSSNIGGIGAAVDSAIAAGVILSVAAGNDNNQIPSYLGSRGDCIDVAATNSSDVKAGFSNYGTWVDVSAPGVSIYSTLFNNTYGFMSGTSMAAPHVTGLAGLIKASKLSWQRGVIDSLIVKYTDFIDTIAGNVPYAGLLGSGRINAFQSLKLHDVGPVKIVAPTGTVDSGTVIVPVCSLRNFGINDDYAPVKEKFRITLRIGSTYSQTRIESLPPNTIDTVMFPSWTAEPLGTFLVRCTTALIGDTMVINDTLSDSVRVVSPALNDVGTVMIGYPIGLIDSTDKIQPKAVVRNYSPTPKSFPVIFQISGPVSWADTQNVTDLTPDIDTTVYFDSFPVGPRGNYSARCSTAMVGDENPLNDFVNSVFVILVHDVGSTDIVQPTGVVQLNSVLTPVARVRNFGNSPETFDVTFKIGTTYTQTRSKTLNPGIEDTVGFPTWTATPLGIYKTLSSTYLATDPYPQNDTVMDSVIVAIIDVGTQSVNYPSGIIDSTTTLIPQASVRNFSAIPVSFPVIFRISGPVHWVDTQQVINLTPGIDTTVTFNPWTVGPRGLYTAECSTALFDNDPSNDKKDTTFDIVVRDAKVVSITTPTGTFDSIASLTPQAVIQNSGTDTASFPVIFEIRQGVTILWVDTQLVSALSPGIDTTINFVSWPVAPRGNYTSRCSTLLAGDMVRDNDFADSAFTVLVHDIGSTDIVQPTGVVQLNSIITPVARVRNFGNSPETFNVTFIIGTTYTNTRSKTLGPGNEDTVNFTSWTATPVGTYPTRCSSYLATDPYPENDTTSDSVIVTAFDVGTVSIVYPVGNIDSSMGSLTPQAQVRNYSVNPASFPVIFRISGPVNWSDTQPVTNLSPGIDTTINFNTWTIGPPGSYTTRCSTALSGDTLLTNDFRNSSFTVVINVDDVGTLRILSPTGSIDSGTVSPVSARVRNFSLTNFLSFPVIFKIGVFYTDTFDVTNLGPGDSLDINFSPWTALQRGSPQTKCSTALAGDSNRSNDRQTGTVAVIVRDVGATQILLPQGQVDSAATITPQARVRNFGNVTMDFPVLFRIDGVWEDTQLVTNLPPGQTRTVQFDPWTCGPRGNYTTACSTMLTTDMVLANDKWTGAFTVNYRDVGVNTIVSPVDVDSATIVPVEAILTNYGTVVENCNAYLTVFQPRTSEFRIPNSDFDNLQTIFYADTQSVTLNIGETRTVQFDSWQVQAPRGTYLVVCSTFFLRDMNLANNYRDTSVIVRVADVSVSNIVSPPNQVDLGVPVTPQAMVKNYGTRDEMFPVVFNITDGFSDTQNVFVFGGDSSLVNFTPWTPMTRGFFTMSCSTRLLTDANRENDRDTGTVIVGLIDAGVLQILSPPSLISPGLIPIQARIRNFGRESASFWTFFKIFLGNSPIYEDSFQIMNLSSLDSVDVNFTAWLGSAGNYLARCSTSLSQDMVTNNDTLSKPFTVAFRDVGLLGIASPVGTVYPGIITPRARIKNFGGGTESFWTFFTITDTVTMSQVYFDSFWTEGLAPAQARIINFNNWNAVSGIYIATAWTVLEEDTSAANDTSVALFRVDTIRYEKWVLKNLFPLGLRNKRVKHGGSLVYHPPNYIYALKGNNTDEFYRYDITKDSFKTLQPIGFSQVHKRRVKSGAALTTDRMGKIYALKGGNTLEFWSYDTTTNTWTQLQDVPIGNRKIKHGSGLAYVFKNGVIDSSFVYCLKGSKTTEFYAYWIEGACWLTKPNVPLGLNNKPMKKGSCIVSDGNFVYALKGEYNEFYAYDINKDSWYTKTPMPIQTLFSRKRAKDGAALTYAGGSTIYAFKGNNTFEFFAYYTQEDQWETKEPIPAGPSEKRVRAGGSLTYASSNGKVYALKGANTLELWSYDPFAFLGGVNPERLEGVMSESAEADRNSELIEITPNPVINSKFEIRNSKLTGVLKIYNVLGELVYKSEIRNPKSEINISDLSSGVYLLRFETQNRSYTKKILIQR